MNEKIKEIKTHLQFLESLDKINQSIQGKSDIQKMMYDVLTTVLSIFECHRVFLLYPCDPNASSFRVPMERNKPEYPGAHDLKLEVPVTSEVAETFRILLDVCGPVNFGPGSEYNVPASVAEDFDVKTFMGMAIYPNIGKPWEFGIHQCSYARVWTKLEKQLFEAIGHRIADGLSVLLSYKELSENRRFLDNIVENIPNMIFVKDAQELRFVRFNKASEELLGYSRQEMLGKNDYDFFRKEEADFFTEKDREVIEQKKLVDIPEETIQTRLKGERILHTQKIPILNEDGHPIYLLGISQDITERKKLEEQLWQSQKLEAVGQLAGGVAHDFNNMLGVIIGHAELALVKEAFDDSLRENLEEILAAGFRSMKVTRQLLAFARKQTIKPKVLDLNKTIEGMLKLLRRLIGEDIDLAWLPGEDLWPIKMDPSQIDQILANLCVNAKDAIAGAGKITIKTQNIVFDDAYCKENSEFLPGEYIMLAVSDNGCGMDKKTKDNIFEPFFTTKGMSKGTGLGLATVYGIVKQNASFINVYSEPDQGSTFKIYLPRHIVKTEYIRGKSPLVQPPRGHEIILLVEDDSKFLQMMKLMLKKLGYTILATSKPREAIHIASGNSGDIDMLITDVIMPEITGRDLMEKLKSFCPAVKCLYMSGYTGNVIAQRSILEENVNFIQKPFSMQQLALKVREVLDSK